MPGFFNYAPSVCTQMWWGVAGGNKENNVDIDFGQRDKENDSLFDFVQVL